MHGYTMNIPASIEVYRAMHKAVLEVMDEEGGGGGLVLHLAYPNEGGFDLRQPTVRVINQSVVLPCRAHRTTGASSLRVSAASRDLQLETPTGSARARPSQSCGEGADVLHVHTDGPSKSDRDDGEVRLASD
jgi:hypothetical protein